MSAENAIELLREGNIRFIKNQRLNRNLHQEIEATKEGQSPFAVVVSCMDSRTSPELIFDRGIGDIFSVRIAGNVITPEVIGSIEYACAAVGSKAVLILGHTGCGAIKGTLEDARFGHLPSITSRIKSGIGRTTCLDEATKRNVVSGIASLKKESSVLKELLQKEELKIIGGIYDITTGHVTFLDEHH
jgi:carbonic anhydrase